MLLRRLTRKSKRTQTTHENFSRDEIVVRGSERSFGIVIAVALGCSRSSTGGTMGRFGPGWAGVAVLFFAAGYICPAVLKPLNWLWFKLGLLLHSVVNPIVMGLLFYTAVWPTGLVMRAMGKDLLRLKRRA